MTLHDRLDKIREEVILACATGMTAGEVCPEIFSAIAAVLEYADELDTAFQYTSAYNLRTRISEALIGC